MARGSRVRVIMRLVRYTMEPLELMRTHCIGILYFFYSQRQIVSYLRFHEGSFFIPRFFYNNNARFTRYVNCSINVEHSLDLVG